MTSDDDERYEYVEIEDVKLVRSTEKAGLFLIEKDGEEGSLFLRRWLAEERGLA